ncbi:hypothetical protein ADL22_12640 [Streptomyces sp. NRRL F-4489]|uniref:hypothetical protein n=1 Tax=Streptomyces sp. NRRL F-4489 TaxID=1609095 RepID=UPI000746EEC3|nr:hypothetical protein [Streptomyces sp. NRRL F-4489]KUL44784.1 hypothetical protein ADL22_12640 [Streptomyces sp. NRRL F-4489]
MSATDPEKARLESRLWHYELAVKRLAQLAEDAESRRILGELEAGLAKANEDADAALNNAPRVVGDTWVLLVQEMDPATREIRTPWTPLGPHLYTGNTVSSDLLKRVARDALERVGRVSVECGYAGLTSSADGLAEDLVQGHVLTLDDGTSLQLLQADLVATVRD